MPSWLPSSFPLTVVPSLSIPLPAHFSFFCQQKFTYQPIHWLVYVHSTQRQKPIIRIVWIPHVCPSGKTKRDSVQISADLNVFAADGTDDSSCLTVLLSSEFKYRLSRWPLRSSSNIEYNFRISRLWQYSLALIWTDKWCNILKGVISFSLDNLLFLER